jgi:hypothetical protein
VSNDCGTGKEGLNAGGKDFDDVSCRDVGFCLGLETPKDDVVGMRDVLGDA